MKISFIRPPYSSVRRRASGIARPARRGMNLSLATRSAWSGVRCPSSVVCPIRRLSSVLRPPSSVLRRPSSAVWRPSSPIRRPSSAVRRLASAFTLIELLVVVVVIAILAGITLPVSKHALARARAARQEVMLAKLRAALDDYRAAYGEYPITPMTNKPGYPPDAGNHYWDYLSTNRYGVMSNWLSIYSPITNISLRTNTIENLSDIGGGLVDYSLTFPLMIRPLIEGKRPFYQFPDVTVVSLVYRRWGDGKDLWERTVFRKRGTKMQLRGLVGAQINRPKAIDPASKKQWKYECYDGVSYSITTNTFP